MANNNNRNNQERNNQQKTNYRPIEDTSLKEPLSIVYQDKKKIFLDDGVAMEIARKLSHLPSHQLRKILNEIKGAVQLVEKDNKNFEIARDKLFYVVPLTAYNTGRNRQLQGLYNFVRGHINEKTLVTVKDIIVLDQLFTSIIAYHKLISRK